MVRLARDLPPASAAYGSLAQAAAVAVIWRIIFGQIIPALAIMRISLWNHCVGTVEQLRALRELAAESATKPAETMMAADCIDLIMRPELFKKDKP